MSDGSEGSSEGLELGRGEPQPVLWCGIACMTSMEPPPPSAAITQLVQRLAKCFVDVHRLPEVRYHQCPRTKAPPSRPADAVVAPAGLP